MHIECSHRFVWTSAAVAAAVLGVILGYLALQRSAERLFEDACASQLRGSVDMLAARVRGPTEAVVEAIAAAASLVLVITDTSGNLAWANAALAKRTGYDPAGDDVLAVAGLLIKPFSLAEFLAKVSELTGTGGAGATVVP